MGHCRRCRKCVNPRIQVKLREIGPAVPPGTLPEQGNPAVEIKKENNEAPENPQER